ncbi:hypothetical protein [Streptomyces boninensis]|uniref:hypothetical protein n=1 Tax=Streptomyces boninensis TaxID=2039455 RepID=UPI003B20D183
MTALTVELTDAEFAELRAVAAMRGVPISCLAHAMLLEGVERRRLQRREPRLPDWELRGDARGAS